MKSYSIIGIPLLKNMKKGVTHLIVEFKKQLECF